MSDLETKESTGGGRTLIAVILSTVVIAAGIYINERFLTPSQPAAATATTAPAAASSAAASTAAPATPAPAAQSIRAADAAPLSSGPAPSPAGVASGAAPATAAAASPAVEPAPAEYKVTTDVLEATFTNQGGNLVSLKLLKHKDANGYVDLILQGQKDRNALTLAFGGADAKPIDAVMDARMIDDSTIEFSKTFLADVPGKAEPVPFTLRKVFTFHKGEYLFGLAVSLENSVNEYLPLDVDGHAYTLGFAPQIGPSFNPQSKNSDYRYIIDYSKGKKHQEKVKSGPWSLKDQPSWVGISGKYFTFMALPELADFTTTLNTTKQPAFGDTTKIDITRASLRTSKQTDVYYFYFGPKTSAELSKYNYADRNSFQKADLHLEEAINSDILLWLENILKFFLNIFYKVIPNYGVAIILVTILVKALLFPLTKKGSISSAQMQEVQPKIQALQAKYKSNPEKLNKEMAELYKTEGVNPMAGCLPLLIQFPIFIAMYNLFNTHFDLRGAMFIAGWIPDLSLPETIWNFSPTRIPILGWSDLRALPIIYLVSQLFYGKFTQQPASGQTATQMKIMMYGMPIFFFFILYDVPSGLLVYWIVSNLITIAQQIVINDILKQRKRRLALAGGSAAATPARKAPQKKRK